MRISKARLTTSTAATILALALGGVGMVHAQTPSSGSNSPVPSSYSSGAANGGTTTTSGTSGTTSSTGVSAKSSTSTPGIPNTGAAGDTAANMMVLGLSAITALFAGTYLWRRRSDLS